jgi:tRNA (guanine37-N1)-methyltransferase
MKFHVICLFPEVIEAYTNASILGRAQKEKKLSVKTYQLRDFVENKWGKADERPYGGGPGMVLQAEPVIKAVEKIRVKKEMKVILTAAGGKPLTNAYAKKLSKEKEVIIVCGRYEGIDSRVKKVLHAQGVSVHEVSVGPYILTGGEVPALAIIDAVARQIKGVLGKFESLEEGRVASHEIYTRPEVLKHKGKSYRVPKILLSGHRANIDLWKLKKKHSAR